MAASAPLDITALAKPPVSPVPALPDTHFSTKAANARADTILPATAVWRALHPPATPSTVVMASIAPAAITVPETVAAPIRPHSAYFGVSGLRLITEPAIDSIQAKDEAPRFAQ